MFGHLLIDRSSMVTLGSDSPSKGIFTYRRMSSEGQGSKLLEY